MGYVDHNGDRIDIGTIVGWEEYFANHENGAKLYIVRELPNLADMVVMEEITEYRYDPDTGDETYLATEKLITVEPWKIGAI